MKKITKKITLALAAVFVGGFMALAPIAAPAPAYADKEPGSPCTCENGDSGKWSNGAILRFCDCNKGESVTSVLLLVVNIMSVIIGILAACGIAYSGIQYLTAGGSEDKTRKAKRRIFEIVLGVALYIAMYAILRFLLPNFNL